MQRKTQEMASKVDRTPEELSYKPLMDGISNNMCMINSRQELKLKGKKKRQKQTKICFYHQDAAVDISAMGSCGDKT